MGNRYENLPVIKLAKEFQHKTIGELPFVEVWDDGDFYEIDGQEENGREKRLNEYKLKLESEYRSCLDKITKKCGIGSNDKNMYNFNRGLSMAPWEPNPKYKHRPKADKCRLKRAAKCYATLEKKAGKAGYLFYPATGFIYFQAHGNKSDHQYISDTGGYSESFMWGEKEDE